MGAPLMMFIAAMPPDPNIWDSTAIQVVVVLAIIGLIALIGGVPGRIARRRGHPNAGAIRICGWVGVFTLGILWLLALVWAHTGRDRSAAH